MASQFFQQKKRQNAMHAATSAHIIAMISLHPSFSLIAFVADSAAQPLGLWLNLLFSVAAHRHPQPFVTTQVLLLHTL